MKKNITRLFLVLIFILLPIYAMAEIELTSINQNGVAGNGPSYAPKLSLDGRYIAFQSQATDLVPNDGNGFQDIFVFDRVTGTTKRVNISSNGVEANGESDNALISNNGEYVVFTSAANNLTDGDTNQYKDIFIHNLTANTTERIVINYYNGVSPNDITSDGRFISFGRKMESAYTNSFIYDCLTGLEEQVSLANDGSGENHVSDQSSISDDGRYVAFHSDSTNLIPPPGYTNFGDIFVRDRQNGITELISVSVNGANGDGNSDSPFISNDGRFVAFTSYAKNLINNDSGTNGGIFLRDRVNGTTTKIAIGSILSMSGDARYIVMYDHIDFKFYVYDRQTSNKEIININTNDYAISDDGKFISVSTGIKLLPSDLNLDNDIYTYDRFVDSDNDGYGFGADCDDNSSSIHPGAVETKNDGIDQDCNGYDLTINITAASYKTNKSRLTVDATSSLGAAANLQLVGYGAMTYSANKWALTIEPIANPGNVTVSGPEGLETIAVTVQ